MTRRNKESPYQIRFDAGPLDSSFHITQPILISELPAGDAIEPVLPMLKLWQERPNGECLWVEVDRFMGHVFDSDARVVKQEYFGIAPLGKEKFSGAVLASGPLSEETATISESIGTVTAKLRPASPILLFESRGLDNGKNWRLNAMRTGGVVKASVLLHEHDYYIIWRGRTPKEAQRVPINLIETWARATEPWKQKLIENKRWRMREAYAALGYIVVDDSQIMRRLTHTRYVPRDSASLDMGLGVRVKSSHCDCAWNIDLRGNTSLVQHCDDYDCNGQPPPPLTKDVLQRVQAGSKESTEKFPLFYLSQTVEITKYCRDHNTPFLQACKIIGNPLSDGTIRIQVDRWCPHCGNPTTQRIRVYNHQLIR